MPDGGDWVSGDSWPTGSAPSLRYDQSNKPLLRLMIGHSSQAGSSENQAADRGVITISSRPSIQERLS